MVMGTGGGSARTHIGVSAANILTLHRAIRHRRAFLDSFIELSSGAGDVPHNPVGDVAQPLLESDIRIMEQQSERNCPHGNVGPLETWRYAHRAYVLRRYFRAIRPSRTHQ